MKYALRFIGVILGIGSILLIQFDESMAYKNIEENNYVVKVFEEEIVLEEELIVYKDMTKSEVVSMIEPHLNSTLDGKAELLVEYALDNEVDPIIATSIILLETGCTSNCSTLVKKCNNVGGQKGGSLRCGSGSFARFETLDKGIEAFINNLSNNYIKKGLTTPELINKKYATSSEWANKVRRYMNKIENS